MWSLIIIENLYTLFKPDFLKKSQIYNNFEGGSVPNIYAVLFEKLQLSNKDLCKKVLETFIQFLIEYIKTKYEAKLETILVDARGITLNNFTTNLLKIQNFKVLEDTGLIVCQVLFDIIQDEKGLKSYISSNVRRLD